MRTVLLNTGTELLAGDVHDTHLAFIAREIFSLGLRIEERRTVGDGPAIEFHVLGRLWRSGELYLDGLPPRWKVSSRRTQPQSQMVCLRIAGKILTKIFSVRVVQGVSIINIDRPATVRACIHT